MKNITKINPLKRQRAEKTTAIKLVSKFSQNSFNPLWLCIKPHRRKTEDTSHERHLESCNKTLGI